MKIIETRSTYIKEPLLAPFGFKGNSISELWQIICSISDIENNLGVGLGVQSVLWSDSNVFTNLNQDGGNLAMYDITKYALNLIRGEYFTNPIDMLDSIWDDLYKYAIKRTSNPDLTKTFVLNSLVGLDFALWQLYAKNNNITNVDTMFTPFTNALSQKQEKLGMIPLITYGTTKKEILDLVKNGCFILKIKIGSNPNGKDDKKAMLEWDCNRLKEIHELVKDINTPYTKCGHPVYYLDANGRYDSQERLTELLEFTDKSNFLSRIIILEEPFSENSGIDVSNFPVMIAGDESAHSVAEVKHLISDLGYSALALKPIGKTLSMTIKMLNEATKNNIPCFCADLTVNPLMVEWNKNIACRIEPLKGLKIGVIESNGNQNYKNWEKMKSLHPLKDANWINPQDSIFTIDSDYYKINGGILLNPNEYSSLL